MGEDDRKKALEAYKLEYDVGRSVTVEWLEIHDRLRWCNWLRSWELATQAACERAAQDNKDAERYRWIRAAHISREEFFGYARKDARPVNICNIGGLYEEKLDAHLDSEMEEWKEELAARDAIAKGEKP